METQGKIIAILQTQSGQGSRGTWVKNSFVIEWYENNYKQQLCLEVMGEDKWEKMKNSVRVGNDVTVRYNVSSREYQGRWFTTASCFYCNSLYTGQGGQQPVIHTDPSTAVREGEQEPEPVNDDMPF